MPLERYRDQGQSARPASRWLGVSAGIHVLAALVLLYAPALRLPPRNKSAYQMDIAGKEQKLVWYKFKKDLPDVSPPRNAAADRRPLRAETKAKQAIIAAPKNAPKRTQMVWTPAPELRPVNPVESPNLLAIKIPDPPSPAGKPFVAPPAIAANRPHAETQPLPDAPELRTDVARRVDLPDLPKVSKRFTPPPARVKTALPEVQPLSDAPQLTAGLNVSVPAALNANMKTPARPFTAPPSGAAKPSTLRPRILDAPPSLAAAGIPGTAAGTAALQSRQIYAPAPDALQGNSRNLNVAIVGLNPSDKPAALPANSSAGAFAAGPVILPDGATATGDSKGVNVPDLFVRGARDAKPDLIARAYAAPTSAEALRGALRSSEPTMTVHIAPPSPAHASGALKVSSSPDARFNGRDVFMMAIQMPNLTSYSGSWLMWYADRTARETGLSPIAPPIAHRKVDPKYVATAAEERVQGRVQLACVIRRDGTVAGVELVRGVDDRLNHSAEEALAKWEFSPATRNGEPVDVDVLVEIPFNLRPKEHRP